MRILITGMIIAFFFVPVYQKLRSSDNKEECTGSKGIKNVILFTVFLLCDCMTLYRITSGGCKIYTALSSVMLVNFMFIIAQTDIRRRIIPNRYLAFLMVLRTVFLFFPFGNTGMTVYTAVDAAAGITAGFLITLIMSLLSKKGLGAGDIKMFAVMGYFAGLSGILDILLYTCMFCFLFSVIFLVMKKCSLKSSIPMAPFAFAGTVLYFAFMI